MAFINQATTMNVKSELDIFTTVPIQTTVESGALQSYRPVTSLSNAGPIEFVVSGSSNDEYLDLGRVFIHVQARITVPIPVVAGAARGVAPVVGPTNNWLHSMFSQVDIYLNQKCITPPCAYNYRAYIENLLNYSNEAKKSHLTSGLWADDTAGHMDSVLAANVGFTQRRSLSVSNNIVDLYGPLHCDLFNVDKYMISGVEMTIKLQRAKNEFHLMGVDNSNSTFEIIDAVLYARKVKISAPVLLAHHRALSLATAKFPITRVDIKTITIPADTQSRTLDNVWIGALPKRLV